MNGPNPAEIRTAAKGAGIGDAQGRNKEALLRRLMDIVVLQASRGGTEWTPSHYGFVYSILPIIIAIGQVGLDKSSRSCERKDRVIENVTFDLETNHRPYSRPLSRGVFHVTFSLVVDLGTRVSARC
jgi:hypothetical protein